MKNMNKILALAVASVMTVSAVTAFAVSGDPLTKAEDSIEVTNLEDGDGAEYIQILKEDSSSETGWAWADGLASVITDGKLNGLEIGDIIDDIYDDEAAKIADAVKNLSFETMTVAGTTATADGLDAGLYYVAVTPGDDNKWIYSPIFVGADYYEGGNTINASSSYTRRAIAKKQPIPLTKDMDQPKQVDVKVGDTVAFTVKTKIPSYTDNYTDKFFELSDTLQSGLDFKGFTSTTINGVAATADQIGTPVTSKTGFTITFESDYLDEVVGNPEVEIHYTAEVTSTADFNVTELDNEVKLRYTHTPNGDKDEITRKTRHYTFSIDAKLLGTSGQTITEHTEDLIKVAVGPNNEPINVSHTKDRIIDNSTQVSALEGAVFSFVAVEGDAIDNNYPGTTVTTNEYGELNIQGLDQGVYKLQEISAPAGFVKDDTEYYVAIIPHYLDDAEGVKYLDYYEIGWGTSIADAKTGIVKSYTVTNDGKHTVIATSHVTGSDTQIKNKQGNPLPTTGGVGTTMFYVIGVILVLGAGVVLVTRRRVGAN